MRSLVEEILGPLPSPAASALAVDVLRELERDGVIFIRRDALLFFRRGSVVAVVDRTGDHLADVRALHAAWMATLVDEPGLGCA